MTDREMLELAAKAAGIDVYAVYPSGRVLRDPQDHEAWNPLTDDGDALRLAVKLRLEFEWWKNGICVHRDDLPPMPIENSEEDPNAATRRAIVRVAAEIGKGIVNTLDRNGLPEDNYYKSMAEAEEFGRLDEIGKQIQSGD